MKYKHFIKDAPEIFKMFGGELNKFQLDEYGAPMADISCLICGMIIRLYAIRGPNVNKTLLCDFDLFGKHIFEDLNVIYKHLSNPNKEWRLMTELGGNHKGYITQLSYPFVVADIIFVYPSEYSLSSLLCDEFEFISPHKLNSSLKTVKFSSAFDLVELIEKRFASHLPENFYVLTARLKYYFIKDKTPIKCVLCGNQYLSLPDEAILFAHLEKCVDMEFLRNAIQGK